MLRCREIKMHRSIPYSLWLGLLTDSLTFCIVYIVLLLLRIPEGQSDCRGNTFRPYDLRAVCND